jgi:predicted PurR-regulated permease PerM
MVKDMDRTKNSLIVFASKNGKDSNRYKMFVEMDEILNSYVRGLLIDSIIVGIMTTILCLVLKLKYAVIFGIIITFLNLIPYIGAIVSYCITSLYALSVGGPVLAIITFIASFIIQMIDANILQPNIIAKSVKLHPVVVICGMLVFERLFGVVGMVIAMPVLALAKIYIKYKFNINFESEEETTKKVSKRKLGEKNKS